MGKVYYFLIGHIRKFLISMLLGLPLIFAGSGANAVTINFDGQGLTGPSYISGAPYNSPEVINVNIPLLSGDVVFENGRIFTNASGFYADTSSLYATIDYGSYTSNIIHIVFPTFITSYSLEIINAVPYDIEYQVRDNSGNSQNVTIIQNSLDSHATVGNAGTGISEIEVEAITNAVDLGYVRSWVFAVDNISFEKSAVIPEPASLILLGSGLLGLIALRKK